MATRISTRISSSSDNSIAIIPIPVPEPQIIIPPISNTHGSSSNASNSVAKSRYQYFSSLSCAGGGFACGTVMGWSSPASSKWYSSGLFIDHDNATVPNFPFPFISVKSFFDSNTFYLTPLEFSWVVSIFALGAALTAIPSGLMLHYLGRKITIYIFLLPMIIGWMLVMFAPNFLTILIGRLFLGISCGTSSVVVPIYNAEISAPEIRGRTGTLYQMMVNSGILFMFAVGPFVNLPTLVFISGIVTLVFYTFYYFAPESPTFLMSRGLEDEAVNALKKLRGRGYNTDTEIKRLKKQLDEGQTSSCAALMRGNTLRGLAITCGLMVFSQMSGINALVYFTTTIFQKAASPLSSEFETAITGIVMLLGTLLTFMIVDTAGRRILLLASAVTCAFTTLIIGVFFEAKARDSDSTMALSWLPLASMCAFFLLFSMGFGPISWIMLGELFEPDIKGLASSIAVALNFFLSFAVTKGAFRISASLGTGGLFWMFSGFSVAGVVFIIIVVPETKRKSFAEIQRMLTLYNYG